MHNILKDIYFFLILHIKNSQTKNSFTPAFDS